MTGHPERLLLASVHDVCPLFESEADRLVGELEPYVGKRLAMLVVPEHWRSDPIRPGSPFATRLRQWAESGIEMFAHGFTHRDETEHRGMDRIRARYLTASEGEFLGLPKAEAARRIEAGRALIEDITGRPVAGFIAPGWLYGPGAKAALAESGLPIAEDHMRVWSPASDRELARGPVITWASRTPVRLASSLGAAAVLGRFAPQRVLRIAVHPGDTGSPALLRSLSSTLARAAVGRRPAAYGELL